MRIRISHETTYRYAAPAAGVIQILRLTPRNHEGQYVVRWHIDVSANCRLQEHEDAFGNIAHVFTADGPLSELKVLVEGEVETQDTHGVIRGAVERFPPSSVSAGNRSHAGRSCDSRVRSRAQGGEWRIPCFRLMHALAVKLQRDIEFDTRPDPDHDHCRRGVRASSAAYARI